MKSNIIKSIMIIGLALTGAIVQADPVVQWPYRKVYLKEWVRMYDPLDTHCNETNSLCGLSTSPNPAHNKQKLHYVSSVPHGLFETKFKETRSYTGPRYDTYSWQTDYFHTNFVTGEYYGIHWTRTPGIGTNFWFINGLDMGERFGGGSVARTIQYPELGYYNFVKILESNITHFAWTGGTLGKTFHFKVYFSMEEYTINETGDVVSVGPVPYYQVRDKQGRVAKDGDSLYPYSFYINVSVDGRGAWLSFDSYVDITLSSVVPFYVYYLIDIVPDFYEATQNEA